MPTAAAGSSANAWAESCSGRADTEPASLLTVACRCQLITLTVACNSPQMPHDYWLNQCMLCAQAQGMKGSLYNRDEAMRMAGGGMGGEEDEDEDEVRRGSDMPCEPEPS